MTVRNHCPKHGYNVLHVQTRHGLKCILCIQERRKCPRSK